MQFTLNIEQLASLYKNEKLDVIDDDNNKLSISLVYEKEGKIIDYGDNNPYNLRFERESEWYIKDQNNVTYFGTILEAGDYEKDLSFQCGETFEVSIKPIPNKKPVKTTPKKSLPKKINKKEKSFERLDELMIDFYKSVDGLEKTYSKVFKKGEITADFLNQSNKVITIIRTIKLISNKIK